MLPAHARSVLIVDDEPTVRLALARLLRGYEVFLAANGIEALRLFDERDFDALVCDARMPVMDGFGLTRALVDLRHPILPHMGMLTGDPSSPDVIALAVDTGIRILEKPCTTTELRDFVTQLIGGSAYADTGT